MKETHKNILMMAVFIVSGVVLPFLAGLAGIEQHLLTMQAVIVLAGFLFPLNMSIFCATLIPILCWLLLGYPSFFFSLPVSVCQMIAIVSFINMVHVSLGMGPFRSLLISLALGWLVYFSAASILSWITDDFSAPASSFSIIEEGWPGLAIQIILIPLLIRKLERVRGG